MSDQTYQQVYHAVVSKAARNCEDREFVTRVTLTWKQPAP